MKIGIIDYGAGNLRSVRNAFIHLGTTPTMVKTPADLENIDKLVFPGQGAFGESFTQLSASGLRDPLQDWVHQDRPYFGICLGYQFLFDSSEEAPGVPGLSIFPGKVVRFPDRPGLKVPHMGWNTINPTDPTDPIWKGLPDSPSAYFVHSFYPAPTEDSDIAATSDYEGAFACAVRRGNIFATQFHPEKSQEVGLTILRNFLNS